MIPRTRVGRTLSALSVVGMLLATATPVDSQARFPNPVLYLTGIEPYTANGKQWVRYKFDVLNRDVYPAEMFAAAPHLSPCGSNTNASRTWVDFFDQRGKRLYGFCGLAKPGDLGSIWFAVEQGELPPSQVYIEINDRQTRTKYKSNLAETKLKARARD